MNTPEPRNWQNSLRGVAATCLLVAVGLYLAATIIEAIARILIAVLIIAGIIYAVVCFERYRRDRW